MYRIDDATAATSLPAPESALAEGYFTEGNATAGTQATNVRASWLNMIQEELRAVVVAGGLTPSKTTYTQIRDAIKAMYGPGRLLNVQLFTSSGTYTPTAGMTKFRVRIIGGGAGGGSTAATTTGQTCICGGGGSGSFAEVMYSASAIGASVAVTIAAASSAGANGNASSFGSLISCPGGGAGSALFGTTSNSVIASAGVPGAQPTVTGSPIYATTSRGNSGGAGFSISGSLLSGAGGAGWLGQGSPGGSAGGAGAVGLTSGAGGSGAANGPSTGVQTGGVGVGGLCVIEEFA